MNEKGTHEIIMYMLKSDHEHDGPFHLHTKQ
jgi:hypothetical protein